MRRAEEAGGVGEKHVACIAPSCRQRRHTQEKHALAQNVATLSIYSTRSQKTMKAHVTPSHYRDASGIDVHEDGVRGALVLEVEQLRDDQLRHLGHERHALPEDKHEAGGGELGWKGVGPWLDLGEIRLSCTTCVTNRRTRP